jgi:hypothetical protein
MPRGRDTIIAILWLPMPQKSGARGHLDLSHIGTQGVEVLNPF